ncbi:MAG: DUF1549 and DUF1553 domain-containing protein [Bryobacterales bacterium]|nr:DUF1549 and DUF1553 domain-containing protein [Bryobacterales bacterium]
MKLLLTFLILPLAVAAGERFVSLKTAPAEVVLSGPRATQQFLAIATDAAGTERDVTGESQWVVSNPALASLDGARLKAAADGRLTVTAAYSGLKGQSNVRMEGTQVPRPVGFTREITAIFTKRGCNSTACHGGVKGRGGFKLSNNALYPKDDYEWIVKGGGYQVLTNEVKGERIPRIDLKHPENSLLLRKPAMQTPHGGGKRLEADSEDYRTMIEWIRAGAPYGAGQGTQPRLVNLEVYPPMAVMPDAGRRGLLVTARFSDGHTEDFTHQVLYTSNDSEVATVNADGIISARRKGETAILIRAAGHVASAGVGVIGPVIADYPAVPRANFIDGYVFAKLKKFQIVPSGLSSDSEFLRRVCLDLAGALPPPKRARQFLASKDPNKREKVVDALIASPEFVDYWTFRFADIFRVSIFSNGLSSKFSEGYWEWIRNNVETNRPYDEVARERISAEGYSPASRHFLPYNQIGPPGEVMAEEVRVFFGRRLDCAQCHNHPYENWSQDQFWGMAAFFSRLFKMGPVVFDHPTNMDLSSKDVDGKIELLHPRTKAVVKPALLDHSPLEPAPDGNPRKALAAWMTAQPYFAEAAVNRIWGLFFARGIVEPVDDFRSTNPPTHPELLAALAKDFRGHHYDLRHLMKTIVMSRTYQLSYVPNATNREDVVNYSRSLPRALDAEVLLDAVADVTGVPETFPTAVTEGSSVGQAPEGTRAVQLRDPDTFFSRFLEIYGRSNRGAIPERNGKPNLSQALHMLAGDTYAGRLGANNGRLARLLASGASDTEIVDEFYLAALSRLPAPGERNEILNILSRRGGREAGLKEFVWALLSSREFAENH